MKAGLNLYSVRKLIQTEEDFLATSIKLKEMGYSYLQYSGAEFDPERIRRVSEASGLPVVLTHVPYDRIINDTEKLMEEHAVFGCKNIGLGSIPFNLITEWDTCVNALKDLNRAAEAMEKKGFRFFYHNHHKEFMKVEGKTFFERMMEEAPALHFTLDTYWVQNGGFDLMKLIPRLKGRIACVHLKDYNVGVNPKDPTSDKPIPLISPVGDGNMDFVAITEKMKEAGTEYFLVEQDNAGLYPDPLGQVKRSIDYIKENL